MGIHPTPMGIRGTFQRHVGTSGEFKPGKRGREVTVCERGEVQTTILGNSAWNKVSSEFTSFRAE